MRSPAFLKLQPEGLLCKLDQVFQIGTVFQPCVTPISVLKLRSHVQYVPKYKKQCMDKDIYQCVTYNLKCLVIRES